MAELKIQQINNNGQPIMPITVSDAVLYKRTEEKYKDKSITNTKTALDYLFDEVSDLESSGQGAECKLPDGLGNVKSSVGGVTSGYNASGKSVAEVLKDILYPHIPHTVEAYASISGDTKVSGMIKGKTYANPYVVIKTKANDDEMNPKGLYVGDENDYTALKKSALYSQGKNFFDGTATSKYVAGSEMPSKYILVEYKSDAAATSWSYDIKEVKIPDPTVPMFMIWSGGAGKTVDYAKCELDLSDSAKNKTWFTSQSGTFNNIGGSGKFYIFTTNKDIEVCYRTSAGDGLWPVKKLGSVTKAIGDSSNTVSQSYNVFEYANEVGDNTIGTWVIKAK